MKIRIKTSKQKFDFWCKSSSLGELLKKTVDKEWMIFYNDENKEIAVRTESIETIEVIR